MVKIINKKYRKREYKSLPVENKITPVISTVLNGGKKEKNTSKKNNTIENTKKDE